MFGQRPSKTGKQLSQAQHLTRAAVKRAGGNIFGKTHDARPRFAGDRVVETVPGTKISYVVPGVERERAAVPTQDEIEHAERGR